MKFTATTTATIELLDEIRDVQKLPETKDSIPNKHHQGPLRVHFLPRKEKKEGKVLLFFYFFLGCFV